jgi:GH25 family lysozyme M1 (1,4-beta-N-acetylmuramidase)
MHSMHGLRLPRFSAQPRRTSGQRLRRTALRVSALVLAAGSATGAMSGVAGASTAGPQQAGLASGTTPANVRELPLSYLRAQAKYHFAGYSLARRSATSVPLSAVPLVSAAATTSSSGLVYGLDVSAFQGNVNWSAQKKAGAGFAYVKATEGTYYTNPYFAQQYDGSYDVGLIRGAYVFANPAYSSASSQANYFVDHGGGWSADGKTLPGMLDIEYNPYGSECYGLSKSAMRSWINSFVSTYHSRTSRWPVIYSTFDWWNTCTGNWSGTSKNDPFFIARYASSPGTLPAGYSFYTFWQYASSGKFAGDQDVFNGNHTRLVALAK